MHSFCRKDTRTAADVSFGHRRVYNVTNIFNHCCNDKTIALRYLGACQGLRLCCASTVFQWQPVRCLLSVPLSPAAADNTGWRPVALFALAAAERCGEFRGDPPPCQDVSGHTFRLLVARVSSETFHRSVMSVHISYRSTCPRPICQRKTLLDVGSSLSERTCEERCPTAQNGCP